MGIASGFCARHYSSGNSPAWATACAPPPVPPSSICVTDRKPFVSKAARHKARKQATAAAAAKPEHEWSAEQCELISSGIRCVRGLVSGVIALPDQPRAGELELQTVCDETCSMHNGEPDVRTSQDLEWDLEDEYAPYAFSETTNSQKSQRQ